MSNRTKKRAVTMGLVILSLMLVVGCMPEGVFGPTAEPITIRFAYLKETVDLKTQFAAFHEKYPSITVEAVEVERFGGGQFDAYIRAGNIDVFRTDRGGLQYVRENMLKPLDDVQLGDWAGIRDDYFKGTWEGLSIQGQQWGIPAGLDMMVMYVNLDQAQALNVALPTGKWSLMTLNELAIKMNYPDGLPNAPGNKLFGLCTNMRDIDPVIFVYLHGGRIVDDLNNPSQATLDDPLTVEAVQWYANLFLDDAVAPSQAVLRSAFPRGGTYEAAVRGACGLWMGWYSNRGGADTGFEWTNAWKMLPLPHDEEEFSLGDVEGYYITKDCQHPKEVLKLLRFLSDDWQTAGQKMPPRRSQLATKEYEQAVGEEVAAIARTFSDKVIMIPNETEGSLEQVGGEFLQAVNQIITEDLDARQVLREAQGRVESVFATP